MKAAGIVVLLALGGCAALGSSDPASPHYAYAPGWSVVLHRPLTIPAGSATVRLQYGGVVPRNGVQEHDPYCVLELDTVSDAPQRLEPGRFEVLGVSRSVETVATARPDPDAGLMRTGLSVGVGVGSGGFGVGVGVGVGADSGPSFLYYKTRFSLRDPAQPALRAMTCAWDQMAPWHRSFMRHLTLDDMRAALGDWMSLQPPGGRP